RWRALSRQNGSERASQHMKTLVRSLATPPGITWMLCHSLAVLLGIMVLIAPPIHKWVGEGISEGIGGSLIAGGIAGVTLFLYVLTTEVLKSRIEAFTKAGLLKIFPGRSVLIRKE